MPGCCLYMRFYYMQNMPFYYMRWAMIFIMCVGRCFLYMQGPYFDNNIFDHSSAALNRTDVRVVPNWSEFPGLSFNINVYGGSGGSKKSIFLKSNIFEVWPRHSDRNFALISILTTKNCRNCKNWGKCWFFFWKLIFYYMHFLYMRGQSFLIYAEGRFFNICIRPPIHI